MHLCIVWYGVDHVKYRTEPKCNFQKIYYMLIQGMTPAQKFYWSIGKSLCTISCRFPLIKCSSLSDLTSCVWWIFFVVLFIMSNVTWWFVFSISSLYNFVTDKQKNVTWWFSDWWYLQQWFLPWQGLFLFFNLSTGWAS